MKQKNVSIAIKGEDGKVILKFDRNVDYIEIDPDSCIDISEAMATAAFECRSGVKSLGPTLKTELIEKIRVTLTQRISLVLNTLRNDKKLSNRDLSVKLIDICLSEIF